MTGKIVAIITYRYLFLTKRDFTKKNTLALVFLCEFCKTSANGCSCIFVNEMQRINHTFT